MESTEKAAGPWYREPWPWIVMSIPGASVVLGITLLTIAVKNQDGLVADDYYKRGLAINMVIERERHAAELGLRAQVMFSESLVRVFLQGDAATSPTLKLRLVHPTLAEKDVGIVLTPIASGWYEGELARPAATRWQVQLENADRTWRLAGRLAATESGLQLAAEKI
ncbi:MAG TPA: FixH family protein [Burkholderiales bacterium]|nr:FixH family protein [Burkholderiales bacterium]